MSEGGHFVQNTSEGPYVGFVIVGLVVEKLGGHVVRRPDTRAGKVHRTLQHLAKTCCSILEWRSSHECQYQRAIAIRRFLCGIQAGRYFKPD